jgi:hypothetical protein
MNGLGRVVACAYNPKYGSKIHRKIRYIYAHTNMHDVLLDLHKLLARRVIHYHLGVVLYRKYRQNFLAVRYSYSNLQQIMFHHHHRLTQDS